MDKSFEYYVNNYLKNTAGNKNITDEAAIFDINGNILYSTEFFQLRN